MALYANIEFLGRGSFGEVYRVEDADDEDDEDQYALKIMPAKYRYESEEQNIRIDHENIVTIYGSFRIDRRYNSIFEIPYSSSVSCPAMAILTELCSCSLEYMLYNRSSVNNGFNRHKFRQILDGLDYLHDNDILYGNLNPDNVLLVGNTVKLSDFGVFLNGYMLIGQAPYRAPEVDDDDEFTYKADVFSLGVIFVEMYTPNEDFVDWTPDQILPTDHEIPEHLISLAYNMLNPKPKARPRLDTLIDQI